MAQYTVFVTRTIWNDVRHLLEQHAMLVEWAEATPIPYRELLIRVQGADALLCTRNDQIDQKVIKATGKRLKVISTMSTETDHIDVAAATKNNIVVCNTPDVADESIADMTMALLLACARRIVDANRFVKQQEWIYSAPDLFMGAEVQGSTIGIVGLGRVGLQVAHRALGFGMRVLYYDIRRNLDAEQRLGIQYGGLDNLLREADFVTLHLPLMPSTFRMLHAERLRVMKRTAYIINMSHGAVVDHDALVRALQENWIAGAGLDVFEHEPLPNDDPLLTLPNVVLTPHIGANTPDGIGTIMRMAAEQIIDVLQGRMPAHRILPEDKAA
jgi:glyoxylate reductase